MRNIFIFSGFLLCFVIVHAQRTCATSIKMNELFEKDTKFKEHHKEVMNYIRNPESVNSLFKKRTTAATVVTIPVVFHILYKNDTENVSDEQIMSQLTVLNTDYRKLNADFSSVVPNAFQSFGADMQIQFCIATKTPSGTPTTGIVRKSVSSSFVLEDSYYTANGDASWDTTKYLNIWVGSFSDTSLLGFADFPSSAGQSDDGLCVSFDAFGTTGTATTPFNKGRTTTHEIGHYFGLDHPWGDDDSSCGSSGNSDGISDTPATNGPYQGCPNFPNNANACATTSNGSMFMNYMDYVDDGCMAFFTNGQKTVVQNTLSSSRLSLLSSSGCAALGLDEQSSIDAIALYPNPASQYFNITSVLTLIDEVDIFDNNGRLVKNQKLSQINNIITIEDLASGIYFVRIYAEGKFLKSDKFIKK